MSLVLQSCEVEGNQYIIPTVKQLPDVGPKISQYDTENPGSHRHRSNHIEEMTFIDKRKREGEKKETSKETSLVQTQDKRIKLETSEDQNGSSEAIEEVTDKVVSSFQIGTESQEDLITPFFKAIKENEEARKKIIKHLRRNREKHTEEEEKREKDEVLTNIFQHLPFQSIISLTEANTDLYKFFNDCEKIRLVGVERINQSSCFNPYTVRDYCYSDFNNVEYTPENIPSIPFCRIMQQVSNLPRTYWPYIAKTNISAIILAAKGIGNADFIDLWKCLQDSKVQKINLSYNEITDEVATEISKLPLPESLTTVNLIDNELTEAGKTTLESTYPSITWIF
mgnify:FL=1